MSIEVNNLTKYYGNHLALDSISFSVDRGEIVGFLGPNGAGKSTTMKILTCFMPPTDGEVKVCGLDVNERTKPVQQRIGYLPENNPLYKEMYVREYLLFVSRVHRSNDKKNRIEEIIDISGLRTHAHKKINTLSKGYRQRVGLAQALLHDPEVLILDEPTTGLDPNQIVEIRNIIRSQGSNKTVLLSTHIMQEVEAICDRVIIIHQGRIIANNTTEELQRQIAEDEPLVVQFDQEIHPNELSRLDNLKKVELIDDLRYKIVSPNRDISKDVFDFAVSKDIKIVEMYKETSSLEDIFRELTLTSKENNT